MPVTLNDIKSELSLAYFLAVVSHARGSILHPTRLADNMGIDVTAVWYESFPNGSLDELTIHFQLKATSTAYPAKKERFPLRLTRPQYDACRRKSRTPRIVLLLLLPSEKSCRSWLCQDHTQLLLKKCRTPFKTSLR